MLGVPAVGLWVIVEDYCSQSRDARNPVYSGFEKGFGVVEFSVLYSFVFDAVSLCHCWRRVFRSQPK